ncbi:HMCN [Mytilus coruscus]|uniref:HMCN n=1 Tax=Mytilus coruscus TaxID=42192 RepID=A0A6J7ZY84_MYTCO|nr:HMCN [Mytilus coruscus]
MILHILKRNIYISALPNVKVKYTSLSGTHGIPFTLYVEVHATPPAHHIYWTKENENGEIITINARATGYSGGNTSVPSLTISYARFSDKGWYTCFARNSLGLGFSHTITMEVEGDVPIVSIDTLTYTVSFGSAVSLDCTVTALPNYTRIYWQKLKNDIITTITEETAGVTGSTRERPFLTIVSVTISDAGSYTCFAENSVGVGSSRSTVLTVTGEAVTEAVSNRINLCQCWFPFQGRPLVKIGSAMYSTIYGTPVTLHCDVIGDPLSTIIYWQKKRNGALWSIITSGAIGTQGINETQPSLTLMFPVKSDAGEYVCVAINPIGTSSSQPTLLTVIGGEICMQDLLHLLNVIEQYTSVLQPPMLMYSVNVLLILMNDKNIR